MLWDLTRSLYLPKVLYAFFLTRRPKNLVNSKRGDRGHFCMFTANESCILRCLLRGTVIRLCSYVSIDLYAICNLHKILNSPFSLNPALKKKRVYRHLLVWRAHNMHQCVLEAGKSWIKILVYLWTWPRSCELSKPLSKCLQRMWKSQQKKPDLIVFSFNYEQKFQRQCVYLPDTTIWCWTELTDAVLSVCDRDRLRIDYRL